MHVRIAVFVPSLGGGGAEKVAIDLSGSFAAAGHEVDLVVAALAGELVEQVPTSVRVVGLGARRMRTAVPGLARYLRRRRPDALLSFMSHANAAAAMAIIGSRVHLRFVPSERSYRSRAVGEMRPLGRAVMRRLMRATFRHADAVVGISEGVTADLVESFGLDRAKATTIYNPVDRRRLLADAKAPSGHAWLDSTGPPVVLGVGRLTKAKDFANLIGSFAQVRTERSVRLLILGEGEERARLERIVEDHGLGGDVSLPGFVHNVGAFISRADVLVLSSVREGFANVVAEALALGTPVVATDCPHGPAEILERGRWGTLVPVSDQRALADAIASALDGNVPVAPPEATARFAPATITAAYLDLLTRGRDDEF